MRRRNILALLLALTLLLPGCGGARTGGGEEARLTILASTYPVYLAARAVTDGVDGVAVERLNTGEVSCLHDYTLTVTDMKKIETADVIALNGADLEEFMEDALAASSALVIDCSEGVSLLENADHVHTEEEDGPSWRTPTTSTPKRRTATTTATTTPTTGWTRTTWPRWWKIYIPA